MKNYLTLPLLLVSAACSYLPAVGPNYQRPEVDLPGTYLTSPTTVSSTTAYWQRLEDATLNALQEKAEQQNLSLKQAWQRIKQARAQAGMAVAGFGPSVNAGGGYQGTRYGAENNPVTPVEQTIDTFGANLGANWEIDLFGGTRRATQAANAYAQAQQAAAAGVRSSIRAEVTRQYLTFRALQQRRNLIGQEVAAAARIADLAQKQYSVGLIDSLALARIKAHSAQLSMQQPQVESALASTQYALESLLGEKPGALAETLSSTIKVPLVPALANIPLPSELLNQRPDVRVAERKVAATTAEIGVAIADLFPRFSLTGSYGVQAPEPGRLDSAQALTWHGGAGFSWALFSTGRIVNNIAFTKARQKEAVLSYQQSVLDALADVESRLKDAEATRQASDLATAAAEDHEKRKLLAAEQHSKGLLNGMEEATIQLEALQAEDLAVQTRLQALNSYINLHQALGQ